MATWTLVFLPLLLVVFVSLLVMALRTGRYGREVARTALIYSTWFRLHVGRVVRGSLPMLAALVWMVAGLTAVAISDRVGTPGLGVAPRTVLVLAITWAAVLVVLLIMVLVAAFAGKPRHLVLAPCRGMSLGQIERWARTTAQLPEGFRGAYGLWGS